jgi:predicted PurR-regulated permease PerM
VGIFLLAVRLQVVVLPLFAGALIAASVSPIAAWLARKGVPRGLSAFLPVLGIVLVFLAIVAGVVAFAVDDADHIGDELSESADEFASWLSDGPLGLDERDVERNRDDLEQEAGDAADRWVRSGGLLQSTTTVLEVLAGMLLSVLVGFFLVKDRERIGGWFVGLWPPRDHDRVRATATAAAEALRGYLKGCATLGLVEGVTIGGAVALLASPGLGAPVAVFTFVAAFVPIVGAIVAGILATLLTLAEAGPVAALVVAGIALLVQQLDNDVLAPVILGRTTQLHPLVILVAVTAGSTLAGLAGAFVAVPLTAAITAMSAHWLRPAPSG